MTDFDTTFCRIGLYAHSLSDHASAGYWDAERAAYHRDRCNEALRQIATEMGFDLIERQPDTAMLPVHLPRTAEALHPAE